MAGAELSIALDESAVEGGGLLSGAVWLTADEPGRCESMTLTVGWHTVSRGQTDSAVVVEEVLFSGDVSPGRTAHAFAVTLPHRPQSHAGQLLSVCWTVRASAVMACGGVVSEPVGFTLSRGPVTERDPRTIPPLPPVTARQKLPASPMRLLLPTVAGLVVGSSGLLGLMWGFAGHGRLWGLGGLLLILLGLRLAWTLGGNVVARRKLKDISITITPSTLLPGEEMAVTVGFRPAQALAVRDVRLRLLMRERITLGQGEHRRTRSADHVFSSVQICPPREFAAEERFEGTARLSLPPDAPGSFTAEAGRLLWLVELDIDIDDWPDLQETHPILVS